MRPRNYHVYIMGSLSNALYRVTNDLERRVFEHKEGKPGSFTGLYRVNRLVYYESSVTLIKRSLARRKSRTQRRNRRSSS